MKITTAEFNPDMAFLTQQTFCQSPVFVSKAYKKPMMSMSIASDPWPEKGTHSTFPVQSQLQNCVKLTRGHSDIVIFVNEACAFIQ